MQFRVLGGLVGLFVGAVASVLLGILAFVAYFVLSVFVLAKVGPAVALHDWIVQGGPVACWLFVTSPCVVFMAVGLVKGHTVFTQREF